MQSKGCISKNGDFISNVGGKNTKRTFIKEELSKDILSSGLVLQMRF